jgi:hypothetical protein
VFAGVAEPGEIPAGIDQVGVMLEVQPGGFAMYQRSIVGLLAAVALLAAVVIVQATRSAEAGGNVVSPECPADIDNRGTVDNANFWSRDSVWHRVSRVHH